MTNGKSAFHNAVHYLTEKVGGKVTLESGSYHFIQEEPQVVTINTDPRYYTPLVDIKRKETSFNSIDELINFARTKGFMWGSRIR